MCDPNPCQNGGECKHAPGGVKCICTNSYTGERCMEGESQTLNICHKVLLFHWLKEIWWFPILLHPTSPCPRQTYLSLQVTKLLRSSTSKNYREKHFPKLLFQNCSGWKVMKFYTIYFYYEFSTINFYFKSSLSKMLHQPHAKCYR